MRKLTKEEKEQLRKKIQEQREHQHEIVMEAARESDENAMDTATVGFHRYRGHFGYFIIIRYLAEKIPGLSFRGRLIFALLCSILLPFVILAIIVALRYIF